MLGSRPCSGAPFNHKGLHLPALACWLPSRTLPTPCLPPLSAPLPACRVTICIAPDGRPTGMAFADFGDADAATAALAKDKQMMGSRWGPLQGVSYFGLVYFCCDSPSFAGRWPRTSR